ncbi:MAG: Gfo/Idh/MocA family oxidoreductase [Verrucomicrobia bacterium]|nr:Gfo/Idh/MocA family oxidoreductase [Verrucomicrobiota bacterium]
MKPIRVGVVGAGLMGELHASIYRSMSGVNLRWIVEPEPARAAALAGQLGVPVHPTADGRWSDVDAVSVCTPDHVRQPALDALRAGVRVLVEKPLATAAAEAADLLAARRRPEHLMVGHVLRFDPRLLQARAALPEIGKLWAVRCWRSNSLLAAQRIGPRTSVAWFLGIHDVDVVRWVTGLDIVEVRARGHRMVSPHYDYVEVHALLSDGTPVSFQWSWLLPVQRGSGLQAGLELTGAEGMLEAELSHTAVALASRPSGRQRQLDTFHWPPHASGGPGGDLRAELEGFVQAARTGAMPPVTGEDGARAVGVIEAVDRSIAAGGAAVMVGEGGPL